MLRTKHRPIHIRTHNINSGDRCDLCTHPDTVSKMMSKFAATPSGLKPTPHLCAKRIPDWPCLYSTHLLTHANTLVDEACPSSSKRQYAGRRRNMWGEEEYCDAAEKGDDHNRPVPPDQQFKTRSKPGSNLALLPAHRDFGREAEESQQYIAELSALERLKRSLQTSRKSTSSQPVSPVISKPAPTPSLSRRDALFKKYDAQKQRQQERMQKELAATKMPIPKILSFKESQRLKQQQQQRGKSKSEKKRKRPSNQSSNKSNGVWKKKWSKTNSKYFW